MNRRGFMQSVLAAAAAPALIGYSTLMRPRMLLPSYIRSPMYLTWCEDLVETRELRGPLTAYTYSASFDAAFFTLFLDPASIKRIWLDGEEISKADWSTTPSGIAIRDLHLGRYGDRIPEIDAEAAVKET